MAQSGPRSSFKLKQKIMPSGSLTFVHLVAPKGALFCSSVEKGFCSFIIFL